MRLIRLIAAIACILLGAIIGALNTQPIALDLGMATIRASLGLSVLVALLLGVLVGGGILAIAVVAPLRRRLRRAESAMRAPRSKP
ncbi:lipopolysaccharide assembly protein LapA domain-containing protein [Thermomonas sp.]|uniref:lipopolysaccharide assembly protein LapA domain-containing protein n=1 Tax=Thermomonas sp. TaxID=1971895 RepID=UPI002488E8BB|nr:lipopolysaccharide assembly protein LapA domain-containing protein [Thermomonas sp.]MDI1253443.1 lipopolysaccharide assembly protein LapA domain-containing protein [Thermomonas sp.]